MSDAFRPHQPLCICPVSLICFIGLELGGLSSSSSEGIVSHLHFLNSADAIILMVFYEIGVMCVSWNFFLLLLHNSLPKRIEFDVYARAILRRTTIGVKLQVDEIYHGHGREILTPRMLLACSDSVAVSSNGTIAVYRYGSGMHILKLTSAGVSPHTPPQLSSKVSKRCGALPMFCRCCNIVAFHSTDMIVSLWNLQEERSTATLEVRKGEYNVWKFIGVPVKFKSYLIREGGCSHSKPFGVLTGPFERRASIW